MRNPATYSFMEVLRDGSRVEIRALNPADRPALEAAVDLASPQVHPLAKVAKDVTAGMVLLAAIASIVAGLLVLGPPLVARLSRGMGVSPMRPAAASSTLVDARSRFAIAHGRDAHATSYPTCAN